MFKKSTKKLSVKKLSVLPEELNLDYLSTLSPKEHEKHLKALGAIGKAQINFLVNKNKFEEKEKKIKEEIKEKTEQIEEYESKIKKIQTEIKDKTEKIASKPIQKNSNNLKRALNNVTNLPEKTPGRDKLIAAYKSKQSKKYTLEQEITELQQEISELQKEISKLQKEILTLQSQSGGSKILKKSKIHKKTKKINNKKY